MDDSTSPIVDAPEAPEATATGYLHGFGLSGRYPLPTAEAPAELSPTHRVPHLPAIRSKRATP